MSDAEPHRQSSEALLSQLAELAGGGTTGRIVALLAVQRHLGLPEPAWVAQARRELRGDRTP